MIILIIEHEFAFPNGSQALQSGRDTCTATRIGWREPLLLEHYLFM